jgi:hypothetical protein
LPAVSFGFGAAVFWRQLLGFTYFVIPNSYIRFSNYSLAFLYLMYIVVVEPLLFLLSISF